MYALNSQAEPSHSWKPSYDPEKVRDPWLDGRDKKWGPWPAFGQPCSCITNTRNTHMAQPWFLSLASGSQHLNGVQWIDSDQTFSLIGGDMSMILSASCRNHSSSKTCTLTDTSHSSHTTCFTWLYGQISKERGVRVCALRLLYMLLVHIVMNLWNTLKLKAYKYYCRWIFCSDTTFLHTGKSRPLQGNYMYVGMHDTDCQLAWNSYPLCSCLALYILFYVHVCVYFRPQLKVCRRKSGKIVVPELILRYVYCILCEFTQGFLEIQCTTTGFMYIIHVHGNSFCTCEYWSCTH